MNKQTGRQNNVSQPDKKEKWKKKFLSEDILRKLWDCIKCNNIYIIDVPEWEEREKGPEE